MVIHDKNCLCGGTDLAKINFSSFSNTFGTRIPLVLEYLCPNTFGFEYIWVVYPCLRGSAAKPVDMLFSVLPHVSRRHYDLVWGCQDRCLGSRDRGLGWGFVRGLLAAGWSSWTLCLRRSFLWDWLRGVGWMSPPSSSSYTNKQYRAVRRRFKSLTELPRQMLDSYSPVASSSDWSWGCLFRANRFLSKLINY